MKHKHLNIKILSMKNTKLNWLVVVCMFFLQNPARSQFNGSEIDSSASIIEVRKGAVIEYSLESDASPGDEFRWEVTGGKIITSGAVGSGTIASPSELEFTEDMHTIEVQWQPDDSTSGFFTGYILVQKKPASGCISLITKQTIRLWSMPTASIDENNSDFTICSGDSIGGYIVVNLTGAADFTFSYSIKSNGLKDEAGNAINTEHYTITTSNDTAHIILPGRLTNPSEAASKYFTIELTAMNDDFLGDGEVVSGREDFTITVYPSVKVGTIKSTKLNRR
jgi:hypothetical protein